MPPHWNIPAHLQDLQPFLAMEVLEKSQALEAKGQDVISFSIGEPDFPTPQAVIEALEKSLRDGDTRYTHCQGLLELREAICQHYQERYQVNIHPQQVFVTSGSSPALLLALSAILSPGDSVALPEPYYPCYPNFLKYLQARIQYLPSSESSGFRLDLAKIPQELAPKNRALVLGSPANPSGQVLSPQELQALAQIPTRLVVDEIYHGLSPKPEASILEFTDQALVINGFSKAYAMTGFRLGYLIAPRQLVGLLRKLSQNLFISTTTFVQKAGIAALQNTQAERKAMVQELQARRKLMLQGLQDLGFPITVPPQGAFYILTKSAAFSPNSLDFCEQILQKAQVALTPGADFCRQGQDLVRFSYATSQKNILQGLQRIKNFLEKN